MVNKLFILLINMFYGKNPSQLTAWYSKVETTRYREAHADGEYWA